MTVKAWTAADAGSLPKTSLCEDVHAVSKSNGTCPLEEYVPGSQGKHEDAFVNALYLPMLGKAAEQSKIHRLVGQPEQNNATFRASQAGREASPIRIRPRTASETDRRLRKWSVVTRLILNRESYRGYMAR